MRSRNETVPLFTPTTIELLTETELLNDSSVALDIGLLEVAEKVSSVSDHLLETSAAVVVLVVSLEVLGEVADSSGEDSDLYLRRTGVSLMSSVCENDFVLLFFTKHCVVHSFLLFGSVSVMGQSDV